MHRRIRVFFGGTCLLAMPLLSWACQISLDADAGADACAEDARCADVPQADRDGTLPDGSVAVADADAAPEDATLHACTSVAQLGAPVLVTPYDGRLGTPPMLKGGLLEPGTYTLAARYAVGADAPVNGIARTLVLTSAPGGYTFALRENTGPATMTMTGTLTTTSSSMATLTMTCPSSRPAVSVGYHVVSADAFYLRVGDLFEAYERVGTSDAGTEADAPGDGEPPLDATLGDVSSPGDGDATLDADGGASLACGAPDPGTWAVTETVYHPDAALEPEPLTVYVAPSGRYFLIDRLGWGEGPAKTRTKRVSIELGTDMQFTFGESIDGGPATALRGSFGVKHEPYRYPQYGLNVTCPTASWYPLTMQFQYGPQELTIAVAGGRETYWTEILYALRGGFDGRPHSAADGAAPDASAPSCGSLVYEAPFITPTLSQYDIRGVATGGGAPARLYRLAKRRSEDFVSPPTDVTPRSGALEVRRDGSYVHRMQLLGGPVEVRSGKLVKDHVLGVLVFDQTCPTPRRFEILYSVVGTTLRTYDGMFEEEYEVVSP